MIKCKNNISILCEGDTEYNYFTGFKENCNTILNVKLASSNTGNYTEVLSSLKKISPIGIVARFALIDFDRYLTFQGEVENFEKLLNYCRNENKKGNPTFLIVSNPDFDHFVLSHKNEFKWKNKDNFIIKHCNYKNVQSFKNDEKIFSKFNPTGKEYKTAISNLNQKSIIKNEISYSSSFKFKKTNIIYEKNNSTIKTSNIKDLFDVLE